MSRILLANENRGKGGAEQFTLAYGRALRAQGHQISLACHPNSWLALQDLPTFLLDFRGELDWKSLAQCWIQIRRWAPHVVHCQATRDLALFSLARKFLGSAVKLIKSEHSFLDSAGSALLRYGYRQCSSIVPVSLALKQQMSQLLGSQLPFEVIYNGIHLPPLDLRPVEKLQSGYWVGYVGSLTQNKQVDHALHACAPLLRNSPSTRLMVAGEGNQRLRLQALAQELEIADSCWFTGHLENPLPYIAGLKLLLQPSPRETFSLVAMEAMALQIPVVAYAREGLLEVVADQETGWLCQEMQPKELGLAIETYFAQESVRLQHGQAGRERVRQHFTWEVILPQWERLYGATSSNRC